MMKFPKQKKRLANARPLLLPWKKRNTAQDSIPYETITDDGIAYLGNSYYSATFEFSDINYKNTSEQNRINVFEKYCMFLNAFDETIRIQIHIQNKQLSKTTSDILLNENTFVDKSDLLCECLQNYNDLLEQRLTGANSFIQKKYITLSISEESIDVAKKRFEHIENSTLSELRALHSKTRRLNYIERLYLLRDVYRPDDNTEITYKKMARTGVYGKDLIAPYWIDTTKEAYIQLGDYYTKTMFLTDFPEDLSDDVIKDITAVDENIFLTINIVPQNPRDAITETSSKLKKLDREKYDNINRQLRLHVPVPEVPRELQRALDNTEDFLNDLKARNEKMFLANILIFIRAKSIDKLNTIVENVKTRTIKSGVTLQPFSFLHEDGLNSVVPLGRNDTFIKRTLTTSSVAVFIPFNVIEIVQKGGFSYGKNTLSNNLLFLNRKYLTNPHGFYFGTSGSGKSMGAKAEIWECFWRTTDDMIIIDPDGEFTKLVKALGGQVFDLSSASDTCFNAFDINEYYGGEEEPNPIPFKSDFIISLIEVTLNYRDGIDPVTRSVIDRCVREIYKPYLKSKDDKDIPTFVEFYDELIRQPEEEAGYLASGLEIYIHGSLNIFSKRTNINLNNRLICFNTKNLGSQLKVMGMTIVQDFCWNLISKNQILDKNTWLWNDEIHLSLKNQYTAAWLIQSWKRGRKYGLIATGMTQEVKDCRKNEEARALIANSEFIMLYRQKEEMISDVAKVMSLSDTQLNKLLSCETGTGLFKAGDSIVEFDNRYTMDTAIYNIMETTIGKTPEIR